MLNPGIIDDISSRMRAFRTNEKRPNVRIVKGSVIIFNIGFIKVFNTPKIIAASIAGWIPSNFIPGTRYPVAKSADVFIANEIKRYI